MQMRTHYGGRATATPLLLRVDQRGCSVHYWRNGHGPHVLSWGVHGTPGDNLWVGTWADRAGYAVWLAHVRNIFIGVRSAVRPLWYATHHHDRGAHVRLRHAGSQPDADAVAALPRLWTPGGRRHWRVPGATHRDGDTVVYAAPWSRCGPCQQRHWGGQHGVCPCDAVSAHGPGSS